MKRRATPLVLCCLAVLLALLALGCATKHDLETMESRAARDREESRKLFQQLEQELQETHGTLKDEIQKSSTPVREKQADIWAVVEGMRVQVAKLQGDMESLGVRLDGLAGGQNATLTLAGLADQVNTMQHVLESQLAIDFGAAKAKPAPDAAKPAAKAAKATKQAPQDEEAVEPAAAAAKGADSAQALYDKAYQSFNKKKYEEARRYFAEFVKNFPKHALLSNAIFWQGECYYQMGDFGKAVLSYDDVIQKHKKSSKYRMALLKQGISFFKIGSEKAKSAGKIVLNDLVERFPKTAEASRAKEFLKEQR